MVRLKWFMIFFLLSFFSYFLVMYSFCTSESFQNVMIVDAACKKKTAKKIFIATGELSGDRLGAWHLKRIKNEHPDLQCYALGGHFLKQEGAYVLKTPGEFRLVGGITSLFKKIPCHARLLSDVSSFILKNDFDEVFLVDFPLFNVPLACYLKMKKPSLIVRYVAPPELWFWGTWGIDMLLKRSCDEIIVSLPHEIAWYEEHGLPVSWYGHPLYEEYLDYIKQPGKKKKQIALLCGSRLSELKITLPIFKDVMKKILEVVPDVEFIMPRAESISLSAIKSVLQNCNILNKIKIISGRAAKKAALSSSCLAITKPGSITLELALLNVPSIVIYNVSWVTEMFMRSVIKQHFVALPNVLTSREIFKELLQEECSVENITREALALYQSFVSEDFFYQEQLNAIKDFQNEFRMYGVRYITKNSTIVCT